LFLDDFLGLSILAIAIKVSLLLFLEEEEEDLEEALRLPLFYELSTSEPLSSLLLSLTLLKDESEDFSSEELLPLPSSLLLLSDSEEEDEDTDLDFLFPVCLFELE